MMSKSKCKWRTSTNEKQQLNENQNWNEDTTTKWRTKMNQQLQPAPQKAHDKCLIIRIIVMSFVLFELVNKTLEGR